MGGFFKSLKAVRYRKTLAEWRQRALLLSTRSNENSSGRLYKGRRAPVYCYLDRHSFSIITKHEVNLKRPIFTK